jgi:hypothetical protein
MKAHRSYCCGGKSISGTSEEISGGDHLTFHSDYLSEGLDIALARGISGEMHDHIDGGRHLFSDCSQREFHPTEKHHGFKTA